MSFYESKIPEYKRLCLALDPRIRIANVSEVTPDTTHLQHWVRVELHVRWDDADTRPDRKKAFQSWRNEIGTVDGRVWLDLYLTEIFE